MNSAGPVYVGFGLWCFFLCLPRPLDPGDCEPPELPEGVLLLFELDLVDGELVLL